MESHPGVYSAVVTDNRDPSGLARVKVQVPAIDPKQEAWAPLAAPMAGAACGVVLIPEPGESVLVAYEGGDPGRPIVLGALWNAKSTPPETGDPPSRTLLVRSRTGAAFHIEDDASRTRVVLETPDGQKVTLEDGPGSVRVEDSNGNRVALSTSGVTVLAASTAKISAGAIELSAGILIVDAGLARFSGIVKCDTLISNGVVASSYTPGAGNIL